MLAWLSRYAPAAIRGFFYWYGHLRDLHSFPTRRSSDLSASTWSGIAARSRTPTPAEPPAPCTRPMARSEEHTSELQSHSDLVCRLLLEKKKRHGRRAPEPALTAGRLGREPLEKRNSALS